MSKPTIEARLEKLSELTEEQLTELENDIEAKYNEADEADELDTMDKMVTALEQVYAHRDSAGETEETKPQPKAEEKAEKDEGGDETEKSGDESEDEKSEDSEQDANPKAPKSEDETDETKTDETKTDEIADETPKEAEPEAKTEDAPPSEEPAPEAQAEAKTDAEEKLPMAASGTPDFTPPEDAAPVVASATTAVRAGADVPGYSAGADFTDLRAVNQAFINKLNAVKRVPGGDGEQLPVASVVASIPDDRFLSRGDVEDNAQKIDKVVSEDAIVASGGYCAPLAVKYDIFGMGSTVRPIRDGLPAFGATRGGIRYVAPPRLGDYTGAIALWTAENDADPADDGGVPPQVIPKPCLKVNCAAELTADVDAVTLCLEFGNLMSRAYPELVARHNALALVQHARFAEQNLLNQIGAASLAVTSGFRLGAARDFLFAVARAGAAYRNRHRIGRTTPLRVVAPDWVLDAVREDLAQQMPGDATLSTADAVISGFLAARNVNITWHMDDTFANQTAGALVDFPATIKWYIFAEGTFLFLDGGTLDLGVIRDSGLVGTNDYKTFVETFEGVAKVGLESVQVTTTTHVAGGSVGTVAVA